MVAERVVDNTIILEPLYSDHQIYKLAIHLAISLLSINEAMTSLIKQVLDSLFYIKFLSAINHRQDTQQQLIKDKMSGQKSGLSFSPLYILN